MLSCTGKACGGQSGGLVVRDHDVARPALLCHKETARWIKSLDIEADQSAITLHLTCTREHLKLELSHLFSI